MNIGAGFVLHKSSGECSDILNMFNTLVCVSVYGYLCNNVVGMCIVSSVYLVVFLLCDSFH